MDIYESKNGSHWEDTRRHREMDKLYGGDAVWFLLGHVIILPIAIIVLLITALALPFYWLWARVRRYQPPEVHGEVIRLERNFHVNPAMTLGADPHATPDISVVIPFYNRANWVDRTVGSVLNQILPPGMTAEIVCVDNASTDRTREALQRHPVRLIECAERGPGAARNAGVAAARGAVVAFTDSDCVADAHWLANLVAPFTDSEMLITGGQIITLQVDDHVASFVNDARILNNGRFFDGSAFIPRFFATANAAYRRDALIKAGGFDSRLWMSEDADLAARVMNQDGKMAYLHHAAIYHQHRTSLGGLWRQAIDYGAASVATFARHRGELGASFAISWKNIRDIAWTPVALLHDLVSGRSAYQRTMEIYHALWRLGFTFGCLRESLRQRVFFV